MNCGIKETQAFSHSCKAQEIPREVQGTAANVVREIPYEDRINPYFILNNFREELSPLEREEILNYDKIHYISSLRCKQGWATTNEDCNDSEGFYNIIPGDHISYRYEILEILGKGTYSYVVKVFDHLENRPKAIKIMRTEVEEVAASEERILEFMAERGCEEYNIIQIKDKFLFRGHPCFVFDLKLISLYDFIEKYGVLKMDQIKRFSIQILLGLKFMRDHGVIHCDLKAENILLEDDEFGGRAWIADFGLACFVNDKLHPEVQSLWCRSPEVLLQMPYDTQIDMWSFGCIVSLMFFGKYPFRGMTAKEQIKAISEILGIIRLENQDGAPKICNYGHKSTLLALSEALHTQDEKFLRFLDGCFEYDPNARLTPEKALAHPWFLEDRTNCRESQEPECSMDSLIEAY